MILHIAVDEKFIDAAYNIFEDAYPSGNKCLVVSKKKKLKYIKTTPYEVYSYKKLLNNNFIEGLKEYEFIVFHSLNAIFSRLILKLPLSIKILWIGWGFDYYSKIYKKYPQDLLLESTATLQKKNITIINKVMNNLRLLKRLYEGVYNFSRIAKRINYFSPVLPNEFDLCKKHIPSLKAKYISWNYMDNLEGKSDRASNKANNILLGNSASYPNNHYEAIDLLANSKISNSRKIFVPLSYGDTKYRDSVISYGQQKLGEEFVALVDFMPLEDYWQTIASCKYVVMNHLRQQAMGNIITKIYDGCVVFLQPRNPCFQFFLDIGVKVFDINSLKTHANLDSFDLSEEEIIDNRKALVSYFGKKAIKQKTINLIKTIIS